MSGLAAAGMPADFTWHDGERLVRFGAGCAAQAPALLGAGYTLLSTPRARALAPEAAEAADAVLDVSPGRVDELAAALLAQVDSELVVGLGGGRVIDTAKAVAAARGARAAAIPTTLSAAEMTRVHRHAAGVQESTPRVRPAIVINDPDLCASQPEPGLSASAANALAHALEGPLTTLANPVSVLTGAEAARLIDGAWEASEPDRPTLALAALLSGFAIDASGYALHHVVSQTLVRVGGAGHGPANAALLPHTLPALRARAPERLAALQRALGRPAEQLAAELARRAGAERLRDLVAEESVLDACAEAAEARPELHLLPPAPDRRELREIYAAAW